MTDNAHHRADIRPFNGSTPQIATSAYIDPASCIIGDVTIGADASVWPGVVIRGDVHRIEIGAGTNIQDGSILHVTHDSTFVPGGQDLIVGKRVTVGHRAILHACHVGDYCLIGMGAIVMDGAEVEARALVGSGSVVPHGRRLEGGFLWLGSPARKIRELNDTELAHLDYSADHYITLANQHRDSQA